MNNKPLIVCLECHRTGATINQTNLNKTPSSPKQNNQETVGKYIVLDNLKFPLFDKSWTASEELLLLQGVMKCGMGNWIDITE